MIQNLDAALNYMNHGDIEYGIDPGIFYINNVDIFGKKAELTEEDFNSLSSIIQLNQFVYTLSLKYCILSDLKGSLTRLIATCNNIKSIEFSNLDLNSSVVSEIAEGIRKNNSLKNIAFTNVKIKSDNDVYVLSEGLRGSASLNRASFERTNLTQTAINGLIQTAIMQRDARWENFNIHYNNPTVNLKNRVFLEFATGQGFCDHNIRPIIINWHSKNLIKQLNAAKEYNPLLDQIKLLHMMYDASLKSTTHAESAEEKDIMPITHKAFKHKFLSMFRATPPIQEQPLKRPIACLPTDITKKIMSFMPKRRTYPATEDILIRAKKAYFPNLAM